MLLQRELRVSITLVIELFAYKELIYRTGGFGALSKATAEAVFFQSDANIAASYL